MKPINCIMGNDGSMRADSRVLANRLGVKHKSFLGNVTRYVLLNKNQCVFALSLFRNLPHVVQLKTSLIAAFQGEVDKMRPPRHDQALDIMSARLEGAIQRIKQMQDNVIWYCRDQDAVNLVYQAMGGIEKNGLAPVEAVFQDLQIKYCEFGSLPN